MKRTLEQWVRRNPLFAFFGLAILICHLTMFSAIYLFPHDRIWGQIIGYYLGQIGAFSPVIAGILVSRLMQSERQKTPMLHRVRIFVPAWIIAVIVNIASLKTTAPSTVPLAGLVILSVPVAILPVWVLSSSVDGSPSVRTMLQSLVRPRGNVLYYLIAVFTFPVVHIAGTVVTNAIGGKALVPPIDMDAHFIATIAITFVAVLFYAGGMNEESGWRGFAQRHLQAAHSPLGAAIIFWFLVVIWHIPNDLIQYSQGGYLAVRWGLYPFISILFAWIYNRTGGSILAVALFHCSMNSMNPLMTFFPNTSFGNTLLIAFAIFVVLLDRMWQKLPPDHPAVFHEHAASDSQTPPSDNA